MAVNVYLKDGVRQLPGFEEYTYPNKTGKGYRIPGFELELRQGRWFIILDENTGRIPEALEGLVEQITFYDGTMPVVAHRETGVYKLDSAEGTVGWNGEPSNRNVRTVFIKSERLGDLRALLRAIKAGTIRPVESHEASQTGLSVADLERQIKELMELRDSLLGQCNLQTFRGKKVIEFATDLINQRWPFGSKRRIRTGPTESR